MRRLLVGLAVLVVLLVVGDRVAARIADRVLASQLRSQLGATPTVHVAGFPFLTQALRGRYDELQVTAPRVPRGAVTLTDFRATLRGAQVPLGAALRREVTAVPVARLTATGVVPYAEVEQALRGRPVQLVPDAQGLGLAGTVRVAGQDVSGSARAEVRLDGDELVVTPRDVRVAGVPVSGAVQTLVAQRLALHVQLRDLPYGVRLSGVRAGPTGIVVDGAADDTVLRR